jgi:hypothetical protein
MKTQNKNEKQRANANARRRVCYDCGRELHRWQVALGQRAMEKADEQYPDFEGWVHCMGGKENFIQADDVELRQVMEAMGVEFFADSVIVCERCVKNAFEQETGRELKVK